MTSRLSVFGMSMERRSSRRQLIVSIYIVLSLIWVTCTVLEWKRADVWPWAIYVTLALCMFVLGGQGRYGLVKSFTNKPPRQEPPVVQAIRLNMRPETLLAGDESWRNDERELQERDRAHYMSYPVLAILFTALLLLSDFSLHGSHWLSPQAARLAGFSVALAGSMLALTLPSALILWREPDLDATSHSGDDHD